MVELANDMPVQLVPLEDIADQVRVRYGSGYRHGVVPRGVYGLSRDVRTLAVPNVLVVHSDMPDPVAEALVRVLFDEQPALAESVPAAALLNRTRAVFTEPVALHPGAVAYYRASKE